MTQQRNALILLVPGTATPAALVSWTNGQTVPYTFMLSAYQSTPLGPAVQQISSNCLSTSPSPVCVNSASDSILWNYYLKNNPTLNLMQAFTGTSSQEDYSHYPIYVAQASDPQVVVQCEPYGKCQADGLVIHIPALAEPAGMGADGRTSGDRHMSIIQPDGITQVDLWQASQLPRADIQPQIL